MSSVGYGFCLGIGFEFWFGYWVLFGFESAAMVVVGGVTGLLNDGGEWLRGTQSKRNRDEGCEVRYIFILFYYIVYIILMCRM